MGEIVNFITKGISTDESNQRRIFKGHITAEVIDSQNDFIFQKEVMKVMETFMKNMPVVSEVHTNRMVGKVLGYEKSEIDGHKSVLITAEIFKQDGVTLYDQVWNKIKTGVYSGLSMGGGSKRREPMQKNGRWFMNLSDLELYEIAVCPAPANPLAYIVKYNEFAKSEMMEKANDVDGRKIIQCSSLHCIFEKGEDLDKDVDLDKKQEESDVKKAEKKIEDEAQLEQFDKPEIKKGEYVLKVKVDTTELQKQVGEIIRREHELLGHKPDEKEKKVHSQLQEEFAKDHVPGFPEEIEEEARKKNKIEKNDDNISVTNDNHNVYKQHIETNINNMTEQNETKTEVQKSETVKVDSMAAVVTDLIKTKDTLLEKQATDLKKQADELATLKKQLEELQKTKNQNPVDKGTEVESMPSATDSDDVGAKVDAGNIVAPKPSDSQASIIAPAVNAPGKDTSGLQMENKTDAEKKEDKAEEKSEVKKSDSIYKVVETVRPMLKSRNASTGQPTAYQMLKALERGFGETKDADKALVLMYQKMEAGEFGDGNPSLGVLA